MRGTVDEPRTQLRDPVFAVVGATNMLAAHSPHMSDDQQPQPTITDSYVRYGYAVVRVEDFTTTSYNGRPMVALRYNGAVRDRGRYLEGFGIQIKQDGTVGRQKLTTGRVPANVRSRLIELIESSRP